MIGNPPRRASLCPLGVFESAIPSSPPAPHLRWEPADPGCTANPDLLDLGPDAQSALAEARNWLLDALAAGQRPAHELLAEARAAGLSTKTLYRAKRLLSVRSVKTTMTSPWYWSPPQPAPAQDGQRGYHNS